MSTKTTFKRIALVAVAALGLGVLSVAPSSAAVSSLSVTATAGSANPVSDTYAQMDTTTAAYLSVSAFLGAGDTVTVRFVQKSVPTTSASLQPKLSYMDTSTYNTGVIDDAYNGTTQLNKYESITTSGVMTLSIIGGGAGWVDARFGLRLESMTASTITKGSYVYTAMINTYAANSVGVQTVQDLTITVGTYANSSLTVAPASSTAYIQSGTTTGVSSDAVVTAVATASNSARATIQVKTYNAAGGAAPESITATLTGGAGLICTDDATPLCGTSLVIAGDGDTSIAVRSNGVAGVATIAVSTTTATFAPKTVTFYAKSPKTITASVYNPVLSVGANSSAVAATAVDANGTAWTGTLYIVASAAADALIGGSATAPVACTYSSTYATHFCPITTIATGTAKFKVVDESLDLDGTYAAADSAATSNEVTVTVSNAAPTTVKLAFDKATYQPYEKALITVTVLDNAGKTLQGQTFANLFATGGITANQAFGSSSDTLTAVSVITATANGTDTTAGAKTYVVYMPAQGEVKISATGGTSLAAAGQVAVSATASVVNSSVDAATDAANEATDAANAATDAALAAADAADAATAAAQDASDAVAALSASVSKMITALKAQITSLTNLVIKIQKKVKA